MDSYRLAEILTYRLLDDGSLYQQAAHPVVAEFLAHELWQVAATMLDLPSEAWLMCRIDGIEPSESLNTRDTHSDHNRRFVGSSPAGPTIFFCRL